MKPNYLYWHRITNWNKKSDKEKDDCLNGIKFYFNEMFWKKFHLKYNELKRS